MDTTKLSQTFKYKALPKWNGFTGKTPLATKRIRFGVEIECENANKHVQYSAFNAVEDHSLKINGVEFVSKPIDLQYIETELEQLALAIPNATFSKRTSVHTHMNVRDFTKDELVSFILLYLVFERSLFRYSGNRNSNPFCIPLYDSIGQVKNAITRIKQGYFKEVKWNKYQALNLCPIWGSASEGSKRYGTAEFRHMRGNMDTQYIVNWMNLQACLKLAVKKIPLDELLSHIKTMNTTSGYSWLVKTVFGNFSYLLEEPSLERDMERGITTAKMCL